MKIFYMKDHFSSDETCKYVYIILQLYLTNFIGQSKIRDIFLKTDNYMQGQYFAQLIKVTLTKQYLCNIYSRSHV